MILVNRKYRRNFGFTIIELLIVIAIIGLLVAVLLPAVQSAREAARCGAGSNKLRNIGLALSAYEGAQQHLPPGNVMYGPCCDTKSYTTWTIELLPYLESNDLYNRYLQHEFNESRANRLVQQTAVSIYTCPSEPNMDKPGAPQSGPGNSFPWMPGSYRAMTGRSDGKTNNWWGNYFEDRPPLDIRYRGPIHTVGNPGPTVRTKPLEEVRLKKIKDGLSNTIVAVNNPSSCSKYEDVPMPTLAERFGHIPTVLTTRAEHTNRNACLCGTTTTASMSAAQAIMCASAAGAAFTKA